MENVQTNVIDINNIKPDTFISVDLADLSRSVHEIIGYSNTVFNYLRWVNKLDASYEPVADKASSFMQKMAELATYLLTNDTPPAEIVDYNITTMAQITFECVIAIAKIHYTLLYDEMTPEEVIEASNIVNEKGMELLLMVHQEK